MSNYDLDRDFNVFSGEADLESARNNEKNLVRLGLISKDELVEDDTIFNEKFVYCASHHRVHSTGWCTVDVIFKRPLAGDDIDSAEEYASRIGLLPKND